MFNDILVNILIIPCCRYSKITESIHFMILCIICIHIYIYYINVPAFSQSLLALCRAKESKLSASDSSEIEVRSVGPVWFNGGVGQNLSPRRDQRLTCMGFL